MKHAREPALVTAFTLALVVGPGVAAGYSSLAIPLVSVEEPPTLLLAQRTIERSWGPSDDSVYVEVDVPEWRSEMLAAGLSALIPGTGQAYAGDAKRGLWFLLAEVVGWTAHAVYRQRGDEIGNEAEVYAGDPADSTSNWSFSRWSQATQDNPVEIVALYHADRPVFYDLIATDPRYLAGWSGDANASQTHFATTRRIADDRYRFARYAGTLVWLNHVVAAVDAFRSARLHNMKLPSDVSLRLKGGWRGGGPTLSATFERKF
jgi:hypothetical protein